MRKLRNLKAKQRREEFIGNQFLEHITQRFSRICFMAYAFDPVQIFAV